MCQKCGNNACGGCQPQIPQGLPGANGKNAFNFTTASFTMPAVNADVTITVRSTGQFTNQWAVPTQVVYITGAGYFEVRSLVGNNQIEVRNLGYTGNTAPANTIATGATVSPAGLQGLAGAAGGVGTPGVANIYSDTTTSSTALLSLTTLKTAPIPLNTLVNNNDALQVLITFSHFEFSTQAAPDYLYVNFNNENIVLSGGFPLWLQNIGYGVINIRIVKTSATTATFNYVAAGNAQVQSGFLGGPILTFAGPLTALDFTVANNLLVRIQQSKAFSIRCTGIFIDKIAA